MIFQEVAWIRSHGNKFCQTLKSSAMEWYRPLKHVPCFLQKPFKYLKQRWRKIPVIVQADGSRSGECASVDLAALAGCSVHRELTLIDSFSTRVNARSLELLARDGRVKRIWYDREVKAVLDVAAPTVQSPPLWDRGLTGKGITVAVVDTGIYNHPDLAGRIVGFKDLVNKKSKLYDDNGHGTHVSGDIASDGSRSGFRYRGPAFEAGLVGVKVLDKTGSGQLSTVIEGVQWCIDNRAALGIRVINMSLRATAGEPYANDPLCQAVEKAWLSGIVVCVAAGNEGPNPKTIGTPGIDPLVITVGALDDRNTAVPGDDLVADFSSRGPTVDGLTKPDVLAPGVNIISLRSPGSYIDKRNRETRVGDWYASLSGTSMATPVCAGVVAQLLQLDGSLTPDQVKARLMKSARTLNLDPNIQGAGAVNAREATLQPVKIKLAQAEATLSGDPGV